MQDMVQIYPSSLTHVHTENTVQIINVCTNDTAHIAWTLNQCTWCKSYTRQFIKYTYKNLRNLISRQSYILTYHYIISKQKQQWCRLIQKMILKLMLMVKLFQHTWLIRILVHIAFRNRMYSLYQTLIIINTVFMTYAPKN